MTQTPDTTLMDDSPLNVEEFAAKANDKVALDIEDAPFLVEEEPEQLPVPAEEERPDTSAEDEARVAALRKRKRLILAGLCLIVLLLAAVAVWFFVLRDVPVTDQAVPQPTIVVVPSPESIMGAHELPITLEPFLVPQNDEYGRVRLLRIQVASASTEENVVREVRDKSLVLRDAVYYYLRNKSHEFMLESDNLPVIKQDILDIINGYLVQGKLEDLFVENYLMR